MNPHQIKTVLIAYGLILNEFTLGGKQIAAIQNAVPDAEIVIIKDQVEWALRSKDIGPKVDVFLGLRPANWYDQMPNLVWSQQVGAGANWLSEAPEFRQSEVILTNASGVHAVPIAEHILALMFALSRGIHRSMRNQIEHKWERRGRMLELEGSTMGLIGVGKIGEKTAEKAKGLNMKVLGLRRHPDRLSPHVDRMFGPDGLMRLLEQSDWVVVTLAMTPKTTGMIGEAQFRAMKKTGYIINIARGAVIQENYLIKALQEGWIAGAGLDVFEEEPLPEHSPLWGMKNVIITPHYAGATPYYLDRLLDIFIDNLRRFQTGKPLMNVVDKELGY
jgi:phosphoglycerate dehydrogenase-like enzyme